MIDYYPYSYVMRSIALTTLLALLIGCATTRSPESASTTPWDAPELWQASAPAHTTYTLKSQKARHGRGIALEYDLGRETGWVELSKTLEKPLDELTPITLLVRSTANHTLELKLKTDEGATYGKRIHMNAAFRDWQRVTFYPHEVEYWWGGTGGTTKFSVLQVAVSGTGKGSVTLDDLGLGAAASPSSFSPLSEGTPNLFIAPHDGPVIDPNSELEGIGFKQRRAATLIPEDPLVLAWLKAVQDTSSPEQALLPSMEGNQAQTFNNALVAMTFVLKGERERAERILDYYRDATQVDNRCPGLQNFFYRGEARGFFQHMDLNDNLPRYAHHTNGPVDRWMGDMAWLSLACMYYERTYDSDRYSALQELMHDLLASWFKEDENGGYVQHGWRAGDDHLHESGGHTEGNIDCYALFTLLGDHERAAKIRSWLEANTEGPNQPLDIYTWRVLAYDGDRAELLDTPDYDLRFRKTLTTEQGDVMGVYHGATDVDNVWLDGIGHMACAYIAAGLLERGFFYANQMDAFLIERDVGDTITHALPYTANTEGDYAWVETNKGFVSAAAWYIFAKNGFNPMTLKQVDFAP